MRQWIDRVFELAAAKTRTIVYLSLGQIREYRQNFSLQEWATYVQQAEKMEDKDPRDVARVGNALLRLREVPPADPPEVDLTEEE